MDAQEQRRLLKLAAKAEGITVRWHEKSLYGPTMEIMDDESGGPPWNPISDDGDALRLAVKLNLAIRPLDKCVFVEDDPETLLGQSSVSELEMYGNSDPYTATRLAIVRAAAAIGEKMEEEK